MHTAHNSDVARPAVGEEALLQQWITRTVGRFGDAAMDITVEADLAGWVDHMRSAPGIGQIAPTYDPEKSRVSPASSYWVRVRKGGRTIACIAARAFRGDLIELTGSYQIWYDREPILVERAITFVGDAGRRISGCWSITGGLWIHPDERGNPLLARYLPRLCMVMSQRTFDTAWDICMVRDRLVGNRFTNRVYGYTAVDLFLDGWYPPLRTDTQIYLGTIAREEILSMASDPKLVRDEPVRKRA